MPYVTLAVAAVGAISAYDKSQKAKKGIEKLKDWKPRYRTAQEIQTEADATIREGFSPEETASFRQSLARRGTQAYRAATQTNPNLANAVQAGINYGNIGALTDFAAKDAQLRRQKIQDYVGRMTSQSNNQTGADITSKRMQEQAYGLAKQQAEANIYNSLTMAAYGASKIKKGDGTNKPSEGGAAEPVAATVPPNPNMRQDFYGQMLKQNPYMPTVDPAYNSPFFNYG